MNTDILVVGAGAAGIAAAVAAANSGLKVVLLERYGFVGGMATAAMVGTICGLYFRGAGPARYAVRGFARCFADAVAQRSNTLVASFAHELHFLPYQPAAFHQEAVQRLQQANVQLLLHSSLCAVSLNGDALLGVTALLPDQKLKLEAKAIVDCSGEALISILADLDLFTEQQYQSGAFIFQVAGLPNLEARVLSLNLIRWIKHSVDTAALPTTCERLSIVPGSLHNGSALLKLALPSPLHNSLLMRSEYEQQARHLATEIIANLRLSDTLLCNLTITAMAPQVGIRTGQRPVGLEVLDAEHVLSCRKPHNGIAIGAWPIEHWGNDKSPQMTYFQENEHYEIPAGALVSRQLDNLFFAGRAISASAQAIASARVIGTCLGSGYAAGMLAAYQVKEQAWQAGIATIRAEQVIDRAPPT